MVSMLDVLRCRLVLESKEGCQYFEKVNIPIEGIGMYGAAQQILEEEIKTELECQNESLRLSGTGLTGLDWAGDSHCMQKMIENFLFIICGLISVTKYNYLTIQNRLVIIFIYSLMTHTHTHIRESEMYHFMRVPTLR